MMFKILVIQTNNLADESLINDRLLFMQFLGLGLCDPCSHNLDGVTGLCQVCGALGSCLVVVPRFDGVN
jgi:hypothetical protein